MITKYENVSDYINKHSIENCSDTFGVSIPTINRWKSKQEFPKSSEIVIEYINEVSRLEKLYSSLRSDKKDLENKVSRFKDAFDNLSK